MDLLIRAVILGVVGSILTLVLKKGAPEISFVLTIAIALLITLLGLQVIGTILTFAESLAFAANLSPVLITPVMKTVGVGIVTRIASDICKDAGQSGVASTVELVGTITALYIALPLMQSVFELIGRLL